jgi:hypothetical protein
MKKGVQRKKKFIYIRGGDNMKKISFFLIILAISAATSCTFKITALPPAQVEYTKERLPYDAGILIPPDVASQKITEGGLCCIGVVHEWHFLAGDALSTYSEKYYSTVFRSAQIFNMRDDIMRDERIKVIIKPYIRDVNTSQSMRTKLQLHTTIQDKQGKTLFDSEFLGESQGDSAMGKACLGGVFLGESALRDSFSSALDDAFTKQLQYLRTRESWKALKAVSFEKEEHLGEAERPRLDNEKQKLAYVPKTVLTPVVSLRSEPKFLLEKDIKKMLKKHNFYDRHLNKYGSFANDFVDNGDGTITDNRTRLMWQKSGSSRAKKWKQAQTYVKQLNRGFAGYSDWRLPTIEELASLVEREKVSRVHIDPVFDSKQKTCWSADYNPTSTIRVSGYEGWIVKFAEGIIIQTMWSLGRYHGFVQ